MRGMLTWPHISYRRLHLSLTVLILGIPSALLAQAPETELKREDPSEIQDATDGPADPSGKVKGLETATPDKAAAPLDILDLDIEQLGKVQAKVATAFDVEVTSVTANKSSVGKSPAAVFVITNDMIRRSGATSIPETFRMVPGMQVAKVGSSKWAISARGFNQQFSNKLLVLVDGRSVYTQFFGGVYWETQDLVLQDIDRIEVIRGPGATVWGANAVNGVINIITKSAGATQGTLLSSGGGTQDRSINVIRQGGKIGDNGEYKVYLKHTERAEGFNPVKDVDDDWRTVRGGFRVDWNDPCQQDQFTLQGDAYSGVIGERSAFPASLVPFVDSTSQNSHMGGANVLGRWSHNVDDDNTYSIQAYVDRTLRQDTLFNLAINVYDLQFQQNIKHSGNHTFTWGTGYRVVADDIRGRTSVPVVSPESLTFNQSTLFAQEELPVLRDDLRLLVGTKLLLNDFTGFEYQPTTRLLWDIDDTQAAWGAISRAVRTPSRSEEDLNLKLLSLTPFPSIYSLKGGGSSLVAEDLMAYELGYRHQVNDRFSFELATFCNIYRNLIIPDAAGLIPGLPPTILARYRNGQNAETYGFELNGQWEIHEKWRLRAWYSLLIMQIHGRPGTDTDPAGQSPVNQAYFMSSWDLPRNFEFDLMGRYVDNLPSIKVPSYTTMDARLGWRPKTNWEFSIIGQNLLAPHHLESGAELTLNSAVNRGVYGQVTWRH